MSLKNRSTLKFIIHQYWFWWKFIEISIPNGEQWLSNHFCVGEVWSVSPPLLTTYCLHAFSCRVNHFLLSSKTLQDYISSWNQDFLEIGILFCTCPLFCLLFVKLSKRLARFCVNWQTAKKKLILGSPLNAVSISQ